MPDRPRILIPTPTSFDPEYNRRCWPEYAAAVTEAGGDPVEVQLGQTASTLEALSASAQGILLTGSGADVDPARYGQERDPASAPADPAREETDFALLSAAQRSGKPVLTVCFGTQSLNVFRGGTLIQDLQPVPVNHRAGRTVAKAHPAWIDPQTRFAGVFVPESESEMVNSSHHQAVGRVGDGLRVVARSAEDGVIEAIESTEPADWIFGVQWHPERTREVSALSRRIFRGLVTEAARRGGM